MAPAIGFINCVAWLFLHQTGTKAMRSTALRINIMGGVAIPGVVAGAIYFVIALTTGTSAVVSTTYGILLGAVVATIGLVIRSLYERRVAESHH